MIDKKTDLDWGADKHYGGSAKDVARGDDGDVLDVVRRSTLRRFLPTWKSVGPDGFPTELAAWDRELDRLFEEVLDAHFGHMNPTASYDLVGSAVQSYTPVAMRRLMREAQRQISCSVCGGPLQKGSRSDRQTCSDACRMKQSRRRPSQMHRIRDWAAPEGPSRPTRYALEPHMEVTMTTASLIYEILATAVVNAWDESYLPLPSEVRGDPEFTREWRLAVAAELKSMAQAELTRPDPSPARYEDRCQSYLTHVTTVVQKSIKRARLSHTLEGNRP